MVQDKLCGCEADNPMLPESRKQTHKLLGVSSLAVLKHCARVFFLRHCLFEEVFFPQHSALLMLLLHEVQMSKKSPLPGLMIQIMLSKVRSAYPTCQSIPRPSG